MKVLKIIIYSLLSAIVLAVIASAIFINHINKGAVPDYDGELKLKGLTSEVTVYTDKRGMPHIYAANEHDLYLATGYVMARERLWQMDLIRRATTGRLSEIFGKDYVETDLFLRSLQMTAKSKIVLGSTDQIMIDAMQAFADGVNFYIEERGGDLPPEFRILSYRPDPWKLEDIANIIGYMGWDLAADNLTSDIFYYRLVQKLGIEKATQLIPDFKVEKSFVFPQFALKDKMLDEALSFISSLDKLTPLGVVAFSGSNNWALSGERTNTGKPILANDMHLSLGSPGIWFQMHQVVEGKINVTGVAVPGEPFIVAGHNERIAWGMTNLMVDDIDLFKETVNPENSSQYYFNGEWKNMLVRDEIIKIKGGSADTLQLKYSHRGPVVSGFRGVDNAFLTMRWAGNDSSNELRSVYLLNRASDIKEFRSAISSFRSVSQNIVYADIEGNIGINTGGGVPVRKGPGTIIRNGETDEFDWKGYVPFEQLPSVYNPGSGYVSSANNKTVADDYPFYISAGFAMPYRIMRIRQMIESTPVAGMEEFKSWITDQHSAYAALLTPLILKLSERKEELTAAEIAALGELEKWDYDMSAGLKAPTVFEYFRSSFARELLADELDSLYNQLYGTARDYYIFRILTTGPDEFVDNIRTTDIESIDEIVLKSFKSAVNKLTEEQGEMSDKWLWGNIHRVRIEHPLSSVKLLDKVFKFSSDWYNIGGSNHTVSPFSYSSGFVVNHGASERHIFNLANWDESLTVIPTGASGIPAGEFYLSQTKDYMNKVFYKDPFSVEAVKSESKYIQVLKPIGK